MLILECVIRGASDSRYLTQMATHLLAVAGSLERTEHEYRALLQPAGWRFVKLWPTRSIMSVIEAVPETD